MKNIILILLLALAACNKDNFLDAKPDQALVVPTSLTDLQALLDNDIVMNGASSFGLIPQLGETGSDNYYITDATYLTMKPLYQHCYTWDKQVFNGEEIYDWDYPYRSVFYANVVLQGLANLTPAPEQQVGWNSEKGSALFYRAHMFYQLAQVFAPVYTAATATTDLGIPLKMDPDVSIPITRATVQQTYDQVINDLKAALPLLPVTPLYKTRPGKTAVYALLARVYQSMQDYNNAFLYSDSALQLQNTLTDYNTLNTTTNFPFTRYGPEVIFGANVLAVDIVPIKPGTTARVDSTLYNSYAANDLRKVLFFKNISGNITFLGSYDGSTVLFGGTATDEMYLVRAECNARNGNTAAAMADLNTLLKTRWKTGTFIPYTATGSADALNQVLTERRKELLMRGVRWTDLRRLNKESQFARTLTRITQGQTYTLPPNDPRYVYPIPDNVIGFNPGMVQNQR